MYLVARDGRIFGGLDEGREKDLFNTLDDMFKVSGSNQPVVI